MNNSMLFTTPIIIDVSSVLSTTIFHFAKVCIEEVCSRLVELDTGKTAAKGMKNVECASGAPSCRIIFII